MLGFHSDLFYFLKMQRCPMHLDAIASLILVNGGFKAIFNTRSRYAAKYFQFHFGFVNYLLLYFQYGDGFSSASSLLSQPQSVKPAKPSFYEKRLTLSPEMFEKLFENRDTIQRHLVAAAATAGGGVFDSGSSDDGSEDVVGASSQDGESGSSSTVSLTFDEPSKSVLLRGPTQNSLNRACAELKLFAPSQESTDQLGLSGLSNLADHHHQHKAGLRTAASWDVNYSDFNSYSKNQARYTHSSK